MIKLPKPAGYRLKDTEASEYYTKEIHVYYDLCDFKEGVDPTKYVDDLQKFYTEDQLKQAVRDALDEDSKACETRAKYWQRDDSRVEEDLQCSTVIRLLKDEIK